MFKADFKVKGAKVKIGELAKATGLSTSRIRFYEAEGLIGIAPRGNNGYRVYSPETAGVLQIIDSAQRAGFSLDQIRHFLPAGQAKWDHEGLVESLTARVGEIRQLIRQLRQSEARLISIIDGVSQRPDGISCTDNMARLMKLLDAHPAPQASDSTHRVRASRKPKSTL
ncbi:MAG: MerR family transcriptional regulator [Stenotrophomonas sp.]